MLSTFCLAITNCSRQVVQWFFPFICILCMAKSDQKRSLCQACEKSLPWIKFACQYCSLPLFLDSSNPTKICGRCLQVQPAFNQAFSCFSYEPPLGKIISQFKFYRQLVYGRILGEILADKLKSVYEKQTEKPDWIIPMPLHYRRLQERGFNQALELALPIAKILEIPINKTSYIRSKNTNAQSKTPALKRMQNIRQAFKCVKPLIANYVLVIDDVMTTTNTMNEFCRFLRANGIKKIDVGCVARTPLY